MRTSGTLSIGELGMLILGITHMISTPPYHRWIMGLPYYEPCHAVRSLKTLVFITKEHKCPIPDVPSQTSEQLYFAPSYLHRLYQGQLATENSRFPRNIDIPRNIRAKLGGSPEYWGESRNIAGISEGVGCFKIHKHIETLQKTVGNIQN